MHLTYVPYISAAKELKTKPTQHSVKLLQQEGIQPDVLVLRTEHKLPPTMLKKVAQFCNVSADAVVQSLDVPTIYEVPLKMHEQGLDNIILEKTGIKSDGEPDMEKWNEFLAKLKGATKEVRIGLVGKYVSLQDAYKSIDESLLHACAYHDRRLKLDYINSEHIHDATSMNCSPTTMALWSLQDLGSEALRASLSPCVGAASTICPRSAFAWVCSAWSSSLPATCWV